MRSSFCLVLILLCTIIRAETQWWNDFNICSGCAVYQGAAMFQDEDIPHWLDDPYGPAHLSATVELSYHPSAATVNHISYDYRIIAFYFADADLVDYLDVDDDSTDWKREYCCSTAQEVEQTRICASVDGLSQRQIQNAGMSVWKLQDTPGDSSIMSAPLIRTYHHAINQSGIHYFLIANCQPENVTNAIVVSAALQWEHPYGFMPADLTGFLPLYETSFFVYILVGIIWVFVLLCRRPDLSGLHAFITVLFTLTFLHVVLAGAMLERLNETGEDTPVLFVMKEAVLVLRNCLAVMLMVALSAGVWVSQPCVDSTKYQVILVGCIYALTVLGIYAAFPVRPPLALFDPAAFLRIVIALFFNCWVCFFMSFKYTQLKIRGLMGSSGSEGPLLMFRRLRALILFAVIMSVAIVVFSIFFLDRSNHGWRTWWVFDAEWHVLNSVILFITMWICGPRKYDFEFFSALPGYSFPNPDSEVYSYSSLSSTNSPKSNHAPSRTSQSVNKIANHNRPPLVRPFESGLLQHAAVEHHDQL